MGLSGFSVMAIQGNETMIDVCSNKEKTKYGFWVYLMRDGEIHRSIFDVEPYYDSQEIAQKVGDDFVNYIKQTKMDELDGSKLIAILQNKN